MIFDDFGEPDKNKNTLVPPKAPEISRARLKPIAQKFRVPRMLAVCFSFTEVKKIMKFLDFGPLYKP